MVETARSVIGRIVLCLVLVVPQASLEPVEFNTARITRGAL